MTARTDLSFARSRAVFCKQSNISRSRAFILAPRFRMTLTIPFSSTSTRTLGVPSADEEDEDGGDEADDDHRFEAINGFRRAIVERRILILEHMSSWRWLYFLVVVSCVMTLAVPARLSDFPEFHGLHNFDLLVDIRIFSFFFNSMIYFFSTNYYVFHYSSILPFMHETCGNKLY